MTKEKEKNNKKGRGGRQAKGKRPPLCVSVWDVCLLALSFISWREDEGGEKRRTTEPTEQ